MCKVLSGALNTDTFKLNSKANLKGLGCIFSQFGNKDLKAQGGGQNHPRTPEPWLITW